MIILALMGPLVSTFVLIYMMVTKGGGLPDLAAPGSFECAHCGKMYRDVGNRAKHERKCIGKGDYAQSTTRWTLGNVARNTKTLANAAIHTTTAERPPCGQLGSPHHDSPGFSHDHGDTDNHGDMNDDIPQSMRKRRAGSSPSNKPRDCDPTDLLCSRETVGEAESRIKRDLEALLASSLSGMTFGY